MAVFWRIETGLSTLTGYSIGAKTRPRIPLQGGRMVATVASALLPYGVMAVGREVPKTPGGWLFWLGLGAVLVLVFRGLGGNSDPRHERTGRPGRPRGGAARFCCLGTDR